MPSVLVLTGGPDYAHDFTASGNALRALVGGDGRHRVDLVDHPDEAADRLGTGSFDALVVNALRWRMLPDRYDAWRDAWRYDTPASTRSVIDGFVASGGGLVGSHSACICFDDWPGWRDVLGGTWNWDRSSHPPLGPVVAEVAVDGGDGHPVLAGVPASFELVDEVYGDLDLAPGVEVLAHARRTPDDARQPVLWVHRHGDGRVVYDGFGHDAASLEHPVHARVLCNAVDWVVGGIS